VSELRCDGIAQATSRCSLGLESLILVGRQKYEQRSTRFLARCARRDLAVAQSNDLKEAFTPVSVGARHWNLALTRTLPTAAAAVR